MEFYPIFDMDGDANCKLWAVKYPEHVDHIFDICFDNWYDADFVRNFIKKRYNQIDFVFFGNVSITDLTDNIEYEVEQFEKEIADANNKKPGCKSLHQLFRKLHGNIYSTSFVKENDRKARSSLPDSLLRVYGIELDDGTIIVTGGVIKLFKKMEGPEFEVELANLDRVRKYLTDNGISDVFGLF